MNNLFHVFAWLLLLFSSNCSSIAIRSDLVYDSNSILCSMEFTNKSNDTLFLPKSLIITPDKRNTINGVVELYKYSKWSKSKKIDYHLFDFDIPFYYFLDGFSVYKENRIILSPEESHTYLSDFAPFWPKLSPGKYKLKIHLMNIMGDTLRLNRNVEVPFFVE